MISIKSIKVNLRGTSHIADDIPCQDRYFSMMENGTFVYALCDGAGSKPHSEIGAQIAAETVCQVLCNDFYSTKSEILDAIINSLKKVDVNIKEYASTLMFVAIRNDEYFAGHVGDGVIGICFDKFETLSGPQNGMYKNETVFLTDDDALDNFRTYRKSLEGVRGFVMMTDGLADSLYNTLTGEISHSLHDISQMIITDGEEEAEDVFSEIVSKFIVSRTSDDISGVILSCHE